MSTPDGFDVLAPWRLNPQVSLRPEDFGALAYHHVTRRLVFLKSPELVTLVRRLEEFDSADEALAQIVPATQHPRYIQALGSLVTSEILSGR